MATIVVKHIPGMKEPVYYYQRSYRVKLHPSDAGKGPGSGPSRVKTETIYLGTADHIRDRCRVGTPPQAVHAKAFGWAAAVLGMIERLGIVPAVDRLVPKRHQGLTPGTYVALGILAKLCAPDKSWRGFGSWVQKTIVPERWELPPTLLDAQNFWDQWDLLCPEASVSPTTDDAPLLETDTILRIEEAIWDNVQTQYRIRLDEVLYDATNCFTFFQPETAASRAQRGHNKAGRDAQRQVGLALAATRDGGFPLLSLVYRGNCHDAKLFPESMTRLITRIARLQQDAHHLILIFDRGNNSQANLNALMAHKPKDAPLRVDVIGGLVGTHHRDLLAKPLKAYPHTYENLRVWTGERTVYGLSATVVMTYHPGLAARQRRALDRQIRRAHDALQEYWTTHVRGSSATRQAGLAKLQAKLRGGRFWTVAVDDQDHLRLRANRAARAARYQEHGKRLLFSTDQSLTIEAILSAYNRDKVQIEDDFRVLKAPDLVRIQPLRHWTDSKIRVYALVCVLALLVLKLMMRTVAEHQLGMSALVLKQELTDIQEIYLQMNATTLHRVLTTRSTIQQQLYDLFDLNQYAPQKDLTALPLHTANA
ncbi:MAG: hypothetical protein C7B45_06670 [Sulfobacillus acidophilus]|uniref:IS1634 family transposase n=1 Tax=Sulfobacillus acidophilus TaxID=53633 RepID=A0A2T2WJS8_9FIRM|nr:MAG: hypothetical protein C7B45_06670 [Sulfobacillus acidophilus]